MKNNMLRQLRIPIVTLALLGLSVRCYAAAAMGCLIEPENMADLGSSVIGIIDRLNADRGDMVKKGQVLAVLRSDVERAAAEVARSRSQASAELQAAISNQNFAGQKYQRSKDLVSRNFISQHALDESANELKVAEQKVIQAQQQLKIWERELGMAEAQLSMRTLKSPFDGVIIERYLSLGERMEEKPIFRIAQINPLRVEVIVPASLFGTIKVGNTALVSPALTSVAPLNATITLVDKVIDAASNTFRVRLRLPNPNHKIPAGLRCKIDFTNSAVNGTASPPTSGAPPETGIPRNAAATAGAAASSR